MFKTADSELIIFDIGGQNTEARKLMYHFQDVTCVVFVVDLSGYDQVQGENNNEVHANGLILLKYSHDIY